MNKGQLPWIEEGYRVFAFEGPVGLKVERLSRGVGKNKSSFYHYFADLEIFTSTLLEQHLEQAHVMGEKESQSTSQEALIDVIVEHRIDLLFNRQLRVHRENPEFASCFCKTNEITVPSIMGVWTTILDLKDNSYLASLVLKLSMENFYLQITSETLNHDWLNDYFNQLRTLIKEFRKSESISTLDGTV